MLLMYIPTTKVKGITNKVGHHCVIAKLYHSCMQVIVEPIVTVGEVGIPMMSRDGV
jgi:Plavaka transposase